MSPKELFVDISALMQSKFYNQFLYFGVQYQRIKSLNDCDVFDHRFVQLRHPQSHDLQPL